MTHDLRTRVLIVDDEQTIRRLCITVGESLGLTCLEAESGETALTLLEAQPVHMILTDLVMPRMTGLEFLAHVKRAYPRIEVAVMTGHGSVETAGQAMKLGAYDYISKPFTPLDELRLFLRRMADKVRLEEENLFLRERSETETAVHGIIGNSAGIQNVLRMISRLKDTRTPVLIFGELWLPRPHPHRKRVIRLRKRRLHRRSPLQAGPAAVCRNRYHLPRRGRRAPARNAGKNSPLPSGKRSAPGREQSENQGRRPHHGRHQSRP